MMLVRDEAEYYQLCAVIKSFEKSLFALISNGVEIVEYIDFNEDTDVDDTARSFIGMRVLYPFLELIKSIVEKKINSLPLQMICSMSFSLGILRLKSIPHLPHILLI